MIDCEFFAMASAAKKKPAQRILRNTVTRGIFARARLAAARQI
jgi:hypothetical protein